MQIRLTVLGPRGGQTEPGGRPAAACDVLVTAPAGTALAAVASGLAAAVTSGEGPTVLYAQSDRLDLQRCTLGEPPLVDGAVLSVGTPAEPGPDLAEATARLHVVAGPDAGGVHLLHGGQIRVGRSAQADVPLDDPDVSRLHCAVTLDPDGRVTVTDLGSTNGTTVDGRAISDRPVRLPSGSLLRVGESVLRLTAGDAVDDPLPTASDGEGHVRVRIAALEGLEGTGVPVRGANVPGRGAATPGHGAPVGPGHGVSAPMGPGHGVPGGAGAAAARDGWQPGPGGGDVRPEGGRRGDVRPEGARRGDVQPGGARHGDVRPGGGSTQHAYGSADWGAAEGSAGGHGGGPGSEGGRLGTSEGAGAAGASGAPGMPGAAGASAAHGVPGPRGTSASAGLSGARGASDAPGTSAASGAPGAPGASTTHGAPGVPGTSAAPGAPGASAMPGASGAPGTPAMPGVPGALGASTTHGAPGTSGTSAAPGVPGTPGTSATGGMPGSRGASVTPGMPGAHGTSAMPGVPGTPGAPVVPGGPVVPGDPAVPGGPAAPGMPGAQGTPAPTAPPAHPATPGHPGHPAAPTPPGASGMPPAASGMPPASPTSPGTVASPTPPETPVVPQQGGVPEMERHRAGTPPRGTTVPRGVRKRGGLSAWARRLTGGRGEEAEREHAAYDETYDGPRNAAAYEDGWPGGTEEVGAGGTADAGARVPEAWPDAAALLLTALGPGARLWERGPGHPEALTVRLGTVDRAAPGAADGLVPAVPVTVSLREAGALGLAGPRERLAGLARSVLAQLAALHSPGALEIVLISTDRTRTPRQRADEWAWLGWLPHVRPGHGQDCRLLLAYDREQAAARTGELLRRLDEPAEPAEPAGVEAGFGAASGQPGPSGGSLGGHAESMLPPGPRTVVVVDGDPGSAGLREAAVRLAREGAGAGIHVVCLAETTAASPTSPVTDTYEAACEVSPAFRACGAAALLSGDVATALRVLRTAEGRPAGNGTVAVVDAVSAAWAQRFARALAPLRPDGAGTGAGQARVAVPLPQSARLLDELGLARATPASLMARWAAAADDARALGGRAWAVLGAGARGPVVADLVADGPHLLIEGPTGSGRTELLRSVAASLAAAERPDRLGIVLIDGRDGGPGGGSGTGGGSGVGGGERPGDGLRACTELPHVTTHLAANDPVRMREFAQSLTAELKRRAELLGRVGFAEWHTQQEVSGRMVAQRSSGAEAGGSLGVGRAGGTGGAEGVGGAGGAAAPGGSRGGGGSGGSSGSGGSRGSSGPGGSGGPNAPHGPGGSGGPNGPGVPGDPHGTSTPDSGDLDSPTRATMRLRPITAGRAEPGPPLARLVVLVDDFDALLAPALGSPGRPAAGSVVRALEAVARDGERLGVHLVAAARGERVGASEVGRRAGLVVTLDAVGTGADDPAPGRGALRGLDGRGVAFQSGRVTGRIPRTATLRPTVVPLEWERMGDPPTRRPVRELGNGPTDLALLASALERAARSVSAERVPSLL
nr:FHA domain-containing protein [Streptomyces alboflavus]